MDVGTGSRLAARQHSPVQPAGHRRARGRGSQDADLAPDVAAAFESSPEAAAFFASLATFYRKGYLRWIDGASHRPEIRARRVRELVAYLAEGRKQRPR